MGGARAGPANDGGDCACGDGGSAGLHTCELRDLVGELLTPAELDTLHHILVATQPPNYKLLAELDEAFGGPSMAQVQHLLHDHIQWAHRDVLRPLMYCAEYFRTAAKGGDIQWLAREIVHMSCVHMEMLVQHRAHPSGLALGAALRQLAAKLTLDPTTYGRVRRLVSVYNDSKHRMADPPTDHLFSVEDAILAYLVCRKLGLALHPDLHA